MTNRQIIKGRTSKSYTQDEIKEFNEPNFKFKCTKCGIEKCNTEFCIKRTGVVRKFTSSCKECRDKYRKTETGKKIVEKLRLQQSKKHRLNIIWNSAKGNAKKKNREFTISLSDIEDLWNDQKGLCYYTGKSMYKDIRNLDNNNDSVSIDRKDSNIGYIKTNVVLCRWIVNKIKNDLSLEELIDILSDIKKNNND